jgi:predicted oxidoreductase
MRLKNHASFKSRYDKLHFVGFGHSENRDLKGRGPRLKITRFGAACPSPVAANIHRYSSSIICRLTHDDSLAAIFHSPCLIPLAHS